MDRQISHPEEPPDMRRDFFAAHAPPMEPPDICEALGWEKDLPIGDGTEIGNGDWQDTMLQRWHELPQSKRLAIITKFNFAYADAMIKASQK